MGSAFAPVPVHGERLRYLQAGGFGFSESSHRRAVARHSHEKATIVLCLAGGFEESYTGGLRPTICSRATALFRPAGELHSNAFGPAGARDLVVEVEPERLEALHPYVSVLSGLELLRGAAFEATARRIQRELAAPDTATPLALEALVLELLASAAREATAAPGSALPGWLRDVVALLHERFAEPGLELRRLADVAGVHPVSLSRAFRRHLGRTPGAYLRGLRLEQAARELERSERPLSEVAAAAGFADQSHFTRAFRAAFGATPGEWRRRGVRP